jgi:hypothetical protein
MRKVFTNSSVVPCDLAKSVLEAAGIFAVIKHELGSAAAGYSLPVPNNPSLPWAWPEVWVSDEDYERALEVLATSSAPTPAQPEGQASPEETTSNARTTKCAYCGTEYSADVVICPVDKTPLVRPSASEPG